MGRRPADLANALRERRSLRVMALGTCSLAVNAVYAAANCALGVLQRSFWFITLGAYYLILSVLRFSVIYWYHRTGRAESYTAEPFLFRLTGVLLMLLAWVLAGSSYLSAKFDVATPHHKIVMIAMAAYTFTKIVMATVNAVNARRRTQPLLTILRNIGCADALAAMFSLQRSMLVSFGGMEPEGILRLNAATGGVVCAAVFCIGVYMTATAGRPPKGR